MKSIVHISNIFLNSKTSPSKEKIAITESI